MDQDDVNSESATELALKSFKREMFAAMPDADMKYQTPVFTLFIQN